MTTPLSASALTLELIGIDSTSGREGEIIAHLEKLLAGHGWRTVRIPVSAGRDDLLATSHEIGEQIDVTLSTHVDTVPPFLTPRLEGGRIHGRGSCDAKGIAAAMIVAAERLRASGMRVALLFVIGEETTHDGAHAANVHALSHGIRSRVLINGEPTESMLGLGTKGALRVTLTTAGRAAHSAYPHLGHSAIDDLIALLAELPSRTWPRDELLGETTVNIGHITGGVADNVIAPRAEARIMFRIVGPADDVKRLAEQWVGGRAAIEWGVMAPAVRLETIPGFPTAVVAYATDVPQLGAWGKPLLFGPGSINVAHTDGEFIEVAELEGAVETFVALGLGVESGGGREG